MVPIAAASSPTNRRRLRVVDGPETTPDTLKSVGSALDVLECFARDEELGVSDIARRLGIAKSTAHRLLATLCSRGIAEKNAETGMYRLGLHLYELGRLAQARLPLRSAALPHLHELAQASGLSVQLGIPDSGDVVYVEQIGGAGQGMRLLERIPRRLPSHVCGCGHVIDAFNPGTAAERRAIGFPAQGTGRIRTRVDYDHVLDLTRRRGVAVSHQGFLAEVSSVAAPIRDLNGRAYAAVGIFGHTAEVTPRLERLSRLVLVVAGRISRCSTANLEDFPAPAPSGLVGSA